MFLLLTLFDHRLRPAADAGRLAPRGARRCAGTRRWFVVVGLANLLFYTELKNLVARVAHLKQLRGEHQWVVTPRTAEPAPAEPGPRRDEEAAA